MSDPTGRTIDLRGRRVLVAEANPLIALDLVATISGWGGTATVLDENFAGPYDAVVSEVDIALVDVTIPFRRYAGLVELLQHRGIRTVLTTTGEPRRVAQHYPGMAVFEKPVDYAALADWFAAAERGDG